MTGAQRTGFISTYDAARGRGAFDRAVSNFSSDDVRTIRMAFAVPANASPAVLGEMANQVRGIIGSQRGAGLSSWIMDRVGFSGPIIDDAVREVVTAARSAAAAGENMTPSHVEAIRNSYFRLQDAMQTYSGEQRDVADSAATAATLVVGAITLGSGLSVAAMLRAGAYVGTTAVASRGAVLGPNYSAEQAMWDFLIYSGSQATGMGVIRGVRAAPSAVRRAIAR